MFLNSNIIFIGDIDIIKPTKAATMQQRNGKKGPSKGKENPRRRTRENVDTVHG